MYSNSAAVYCKSGPVSMDTPGSILYWEGEGKHCAKFTLVGLEEVRRHSVGEDCGGYLTSELDFSYCEFRHPPFPGLAIPTFSCKPLQSGCDPQLNQL